MLRNMCRCPILKKSAIPLFIQKHSFLTNDYQCNDAWISQTSSPLLNKINLNDFYNIIDQNYSSRGVISAIDVDVFANAIRDSGHLDELRDLLYKLRRSAETGNMLESTHQATVRKYLQFGNLKELISILKDPLNFGVFLDDFTANILLDKLIKSSSFEQAANVASFIMLQEDYNNDITCALCQYASYKYITSYIKPQQPQTTEEKKKKVEEIKIRVKFLRNPYHDDHFDIEDAYTLSGKTLAWLSETRTDNLNCNLQIIGWLCYQKYDKLLTLIEAISKQESFKIYNEVNELLKKNSDYAKEDTKSTLEQCMSLLSQVSPAEVSLEEAIKTSIENAINKTQNNDIEKQLQMFQSWENIRALKLDEQAKRLDRAKRIELISLKQKELVNEEQKLWFFENEDQIDLEIEEKERGVTDTASKKKVLNKADDDYIPPEILPKKK